MAQIQIESITPVTMDASLPAPLFANQRSNHSPFHPLPANTSLVQYWSRNSDGASTTKVSLTNGDAGQRRRGGRFCCRPSDFFRTAPQGAVFHVRRKFRLKATKTRPGAVSGGEFSDTLPVHSMIRMRRLAMNFVMNRWAYGTLAAVVGVVMAYAMSLRYDNPWIFYVGAPVAVVSSFALTPIHREAQWVGVVRR